MYRDEWIAGAREEYERWQWKATSFKDGAVVHHVRTLHYGQQQISASVVETAECVTWEAHRAGVRSSPQVVGSLADAKMLADAAVQRLIELAANDAVFAHAMRQSQAPRPPTNDRPNEWGGGMSADHD